MNLEDFYFCNKLVLFYQSQDDFAFRKVASTKVDIFFECSAHIFLAK